LNSTRVSPAQAGQDEQSNAPSCRPAEDFNQVIAMFFSKLKKNAAPAIGIIAALAAFCLLTSSAAAHPRVVVHNHVHVGPKNNIGYVHNGVTYRHYCYDSRWAGWNNRRWYAPLGAYVYWCPIQSVWYRYDVSSSVYLPIYID
jgi:hypothetical protein